MKELKNKLTDDIQEKLGKTSEIDSKQMTELIDLENKYSNVSVVKYGFFLLF